MGVLRLSSHPLPRVPMRFFPVTGSRRLQIAITSVSYVVSRTAYYPSVISHRLGDVTKILIGVCFMLSTLLSWGTSYSSLCLFGIKVDVPTIHVLYEREVEERTDIDCGDFN